MTRSAPRWWRSIRSEIRPLSRLVSPTAEVGIATSTPAGLAASRRRRRADERLLEILDQVARGLDPHGEAHEVPRRRERRVRRRGVRHARGVLDQALDSAEALRELPDLRSRHELDGRLFGLHQERDHPAEVVHLALRDL